MKLAKNKYTIHALIPDVLFLSFCGLASSVDWSNPSNSIGIAHTYEGSSDTVTCKTCKKLMQKYIIRKLKNEIM